jgi:hypothetical protein
MLRSKGFSLNFASSSTKPQHEEIIDEGKHKKNIKI